MPLIPLPKLLEKTQKVVNAYIRKRDEGYWYSDGVDAIPFQDSCNKYNLFDTLK